MSLSSTLPPPPTAEQMTLAWFMSPTGKAVLAAYMQAVSAHHNQQTVAIVNGQRKPPVVAQSVGGTSILELPIS